MTLAFQQHRDSETGRDPERNPEESGVGDIRERRPQVKAVFPQQLRVVARSDPTGRVQHIVVAEAEEEAHDDRPGRQGEKTEEPGRDKEVARRRFRPRHPSEPEQAVETDQEDDQRGRHQDPDDRDRYARIQRRLIALVEHLVEFTLHDPRTVVERLLRGDMCIDMMGRVVEGAHMLVPEPLPHKRDRAEARVVHHRDEQIDRVAILGRRRRELREDPHR